MDNQTPSSSTPTPASVTPVPAQPIPVTPVGVTPSPMPATSALSGMPAGGILPSSGPFASKGGGLGGGGGSSPIMLVLIVILALGTLGFGVTAVVSYNKATVATKTLEQQKAAAVALAKKEQRKADDEEHTQANESPFRSYVAPVEYGSFEIKFPKNWSSYVAQEKSGNQVTLVINPDFVRRTNGTDELVATRVQLIEKSKDSFLGSYSGQLKKGTLKQADITVSGLKSYDITGTFADKKTTRQVIVPVRDKVIVFTIENSKYSTEFNQILSQAKIVP